MSTILGVFVALDHKLLELILPEHKEAPFIINNSRSLRLATTDGALEWSIK